MNDTNTGFGESGIFGPVAYVGYGFADGTGYTAGNGGLVWGLIHFSTPVSRLFFSYLYGDITISDNLGDNLGFEVTDSPNNPGDGTFLGPGITQLTWNTGVLTSSGITSLTYTLDSADPPSVPKPSSLLLSGMGLTALIGLARRNRTTLT
jgi:hypothetical protein